MSNHSSHDSHHAHPEAHFGSTATVRDIVLGMADGLTVPFALAAGLSGAVDTSKIVIAAGLAEIAAGTIAMGLGGYLAGRTAYEHFHSEWKREERECNEIPEKEAAEVAAIFRGYGLAESDIDRVVTSIRADKRRWVDFMMKFELGLQEPDPKRARQSAINIGLSYMFGGLVPLAPYFLTHHAPTALTISASITLLTLWVFGYVKGRFTGQRPFRAAFQTLLVGGLAAAAAYVIARLVT